jgi:hypothetical protein
LDKLDFTWIQFNVVLEKRHRARPPPHPNSYKKLACIGNACPDRNGYDVLELFDFLMVCVSARLRSRMWLLNIYCVFAILSIKGAVRKVVGVGKLKIKHLDEIPYLFARLGEPGIKDRVIEQWKSASKDRHHPVSVHIMDESSNLARCAM